MLWVLIRENRKYNLVEKVTLSGAILTDFFAFIIDHFGRGLCSIGFILSLSQHNLGTCPGGHTDLLMFLNRYGKCLWYPNILCKLNNEFVFTCRDYSAKYGPLH